MHIVDGTRGFQGVIESFVGGCPDEKIGRGSFLKRLDEYLAPSPFNPKSRASSRYLGHRFVHLNQGQMVQGSSHLDDLSILSVRLLHDLSLTRADSQCRDNDQKN